MCKQIVLPTEEEAERFSDEFDMVVEETLTQLLESGQRTRTDIILKQHGATESSPVRMAATLYVAKLVESDPEIDRYENPTEDELRAVLAKAWSYSGPWYHSLVVLRFTGHWTPLQEAVAELDEESGVFLKFYYPSVEDKR